MEPYHIVFASSVVACAGILLFLNFIVLNKIFLELASLKNEAIKPADAIKQVVTLNSDTVALGNLPRRKPVHINDETACEIEKENLRKPRL